MVRTISRWQRFTDKETDILYSALMEYRKNLDTNIQGTASEIVGAMLAELISEPRRENGGK